MPFFTTTSHLSHRSRLPASTSFNAAVALLQDHDFIIGLNKTLVKYTLDTPPATSKPATKYYTMTDHMEALPAGLWGTSVTFTAEITDLPTGCQWFIKAPLGFLQTTTWSIQAAAEPKTGFDLVEDVEISCPRLLAGNVMNRIGSDAPRIHNLFAEKLLETSSIT